MKKALSFLFAILAFVLVANNRAGSVNYQEGKSIVAAHGSGNAIWTPVSCSQNAGQFFQQIIGSRLPSPPGFSEQRHKKTRFGERIAAFLEVRFLKIFRIQTDDPISTDPVIDPLRSTAVCLRGPPQAC